MTHSGFDLRRPADKAAVSALYKQMREQQFRQACELFLSLWKSDQDLKDIELLQLYESQQESERR